MQGLGFWIEGLGIRDVAVYRDLRIVGVGLEGVWISGLRVKGFRGRVLEFGTMEEEFGA